MDLGGWGKQGLVALLPERGSLLRAQGFLSGRSKEIDFPTVMRSLACQKALYRFIRERE